MHRYDDIFKHIERPFAFVDMDALDANIESVKRACQNKSVRIATKSVRSVELLQYIANKLPNCNGYMSFTASETVFLLQQGLDNILLGYPVFERLAIERLALFVKAGKSVTFMVDAVEQVQLLHEIASKHNIVFAICVDINVSTDYKILYFGTKRSPLQSINQLQLFIQQIVPLDHVRITGCMAYDAQIAGVTDKTPQLLGMKSALIRQLKKHSLSHVTTLRWDALALLKSKYDIEFVNAGGTGSMHVLFDAPDVTEITVGSAFFAPALFSQYEALHLQPAVGFGLRITRMFSSNIVVCHGGGYIASGAIGHDRLPQFLEPAYYKFSALEGAGEVQTPIEVTGRTHSIGDTIYFRHAKAGELCERFNELHATRNNDYVGKYLTYRGNGQCFL